MNIKYRKIHHKTFHLSIILGFGRTMFSMIGKCRQFSFFCKPDYGTRLK